MKKAILTIGIPGCGKSTWAKKQEGFIDINLDDCREMVSGDSSDQSSTLNAIDLRNSLIKKCSIEEKNIIISDTNLNEFYRNKLEEMLINLGFEIERVLFAVSFETCLFRNSNRKRVVSFDILDQLNKSLSSQKIESNRVVDNSGNVFLLNDLFDLIKFVFFQEKSLFLEDTKLVFGDNLTENGTIIYSFLEKNFNLNNFNPFVFKNGLKMEKFDEKLFLKESGINESSLIKIDYMDSSLYENIDGLWKSESLFFKIKSNLSLFLDKN